MKIIYTCEKCGKDFNSYEKCIEHENKCNKDFNSYEKCIEHENKCNKQNFFICYKCGKTNIWHNNDSNAFEIENQCHSINLGRMGYGSKLDGCDVNFNLCDKCLYNLIETFKLKDEIYNSGSNRYYNYYDKNEEEEINYDN